MTFLDASRVTVVRDGSTLLEDMSLAADRRELLGVIGPNGAGKTTLLRTLAGDITPDRGTVSIAGRHIAGLSLRELARIRAFLGAALPADIGFTVGEVVTMGNPVESVDDVAAALRATDTGHLVDRVFASLSTGEQQRVAIARVLVQPSPLVLLDEPTASLDIGHQELVMRMMRIEVGSGRTVVAAIHDLNLAAAHADRLVLLDRGRLVASGSPYEVLTSERLSEVYQQELRVTPHPHRDCLLVLASDPPPPSQTE